MDTYDFPFFEEYLDSIDTIEDRDAVTSVAGFLEEHKLLGMKWPEYKLNYEDDFEKLAGIVFDEGEWCIFMAALANTKLKERRFSPYSFTVLNE